MGPGVCEPLPSEVTTSFVTKCASPYPFLDLGSLIFLLLVGCFNMSSALIWNVFFLTKLTTPACHRRDVAV